MGSEMCIRDRGIIMSTEELEKEVAKFHNISLEELYERTVKGGEALFHQYYMRDGIGF